MAIGIDRTSGNHASWPKAPRHDDCSGPAMPNTEVTTNPRMYAGIASGNTRAQEKNRRPGNSWAPTSQARPTPRITVEVQTPPTRISEETISLGRRPSHCWRHTSVLGRSTPPITAITGITAAPAATTATAPHPPIERRAARAAVDIWR